MKYTPRGFAIYSELTDSYGSRIRIQKSSSAEDDCVWIFAEDKNGEEPAPSPHLTVEQAKAVIKGLQDFIDDVEQPPKQESN